MTWESADDETNRYVEDPTPEEYAEALRVNLRKAREYIDEQIENPTCDAFILGIYFDGEPGADSREVEMTCIGAGDTENTTILFSLIGARLVDLIEEPK